MQTEQGTNFKFKNIQLDTPPPLPFPLRKRYTSSTNSMNSLNSPTRGVQHCSDYVLFSLSIFKISFLQQKRPTNLQRIEDETDSYFTSPLRKKTVRKFTLQGEITQPETC